MSVWASTSASPGPVRASTRPSRSVPDGSTAAVRADLRPATISALRACGGRASLASTAFVRACLPKDPPRSVEQLVDRARALEGLTVGALLERLGLTASSDPVRTKGSVGEVLERALGASGGSSRVHDFPELGVELKTVPVTSAGQPLESTHVCTLSLADAESQEWETSWVRAKLARVLFVPHVGEHGVPWRERTIGHAVLWSPTPEQQSILRADFDDVVGLVGVGRVEELTAHQGRWLQVRPKARDGRARTLAWGAGGEAIATVPRGFYLRARFTGALLRDPTAVPRSF